MDPRRRADRELSADHALDIAGVHLQRPAAEVLTLAARQAQPRPDPLGDEAPLALGDRGDDGEDRLVERRTGLVRHSGGTPIEPKSFSEHFYRGQGALGIRPRGLYCTKDTFVTTALEAGVKIAWLEQQTGV